MKKYFLFIFILSFSLVVKAQPLQSPDEFLGYKAGTKYTPHHKVVSYLKHLAAAKPEMIKLEQYGNTYEGRELMLAIVALPANLTNLESIRQNNLRLTGILKDKPAITDRAPSIVWLSYNVHGNEPSSTEAALQTLYALVDPANTQTKEWLKNTVVIIDPCLNPDGRDRYVNWFTSMVGATPNADPQSREHIEPWPGGRSNHYNFDLNRDWAWQTQIETQARIVKYNHWMPQIHVDFHEQFYNNPYYFAPAAEPFHEVITPWQRSFQETIGRNNAKYFDQKGWLYFTKESFDLFYPSYGDTYPTYNGAIGMTYEQGGHSRGGLAVKTDDGDTLTLADRIHHHFTTSLSTIEVASIHNANLIEGYKKYFEESRVGKGNPYKAYIISSDNLGKIQSLTELLKRNGIEFGHVNATMLKGINYRNNKEEAIQLKKYNLAISTAQPRSVMAKVLLEPVSVLPDSNTYDITAWSLPFAYGVDAWAVKETVNILPVIPSSDATSLKSSSYGYLIKYQSLSAVKTLGKLLQQGIKVRYAEKPISYKGKKFDRGTLIVLTKSNPADLHGRLEKLLQENLLEIEPIETGFMDKGPDLGSPFIHFIEQPKVAMLTGDQVSSLNAGEIWHMFDQTLQYPITLINASDFSRISLKDYNVIILPNGNYRLLKDKHSNEKLMEFVKAGGRLIAIEDAVSQLADADWGIKLKETKTAEKDIYSKLKKYEDRERDALPDAIPGAIYKIQLDETHPLAFGYGNNYYSLKQDPKLYEFLEDGWNVGYIKKDNYHTGFAGANIKEKLKDGLVFGVQEMGRGSVIYLSDNPLFRQFWENGKLMLCNAVFLVGQ